MPYLGWRWKVAQLPRGGDFRHAAHGRSGGPGAWWPSPTAAWSPIFGTAPLLKAPTQRRVYPPGPRLRRRLRVRRCRPESVDRGEPQPGRRLPARLWQAGAPCQGPAHCRSTPSTPGPRRKATSARWLSAARRGDAARHWRDGLRRRPFAGKLAASGETARCLVRRKTLARPLPRGREAAFGDLSTGDGLDEALRGSRYGHPSGGRHQGAARRRLLRGQCARHGDVGERHGRAVRSASCTSARWRPPGRANASPKTPSRGRSPNMAARSWKASGSCGRCCPDAVIVRPPVVYGPRDTDVFQVLKSAAKRPGPGNRRRRPLVQRDLREGLGRGADAGRARAPGPPAGPTSWRTPAGLVARAGRDRGPHSWDAKRLASCASRTPRPYAVGACAEAWSRLTGTTRHRVA